MGFVHMPVLWERLTAVGSCRILVVPLSQVVSAPPLSMSSRHRNKIPSSPNICSCPGPPKLSKGEAGKALE